MIKLFLQSFLGGLSIAIAGNIYLRTGGVIGSFLFSAGLLIILNMNWKLFTGTVGFIKTKKDIKDNIIILFGNIVGVSGSLAMPTDSAVQLVASKLLIPLPIVFIKGIICGLLIYCAVVCFREHKDYMVCACVASFILCGAEHCIADLYYILIANMLTPNSLLFFIIVLIGNSVGAILVDKIKKL